MSKDLLYELIEALTILPGVGKKSAQRMALFLLDKNKDGALHLAQTLEECLEAIQRCDICRQLTSESICRICNDESRDAYSLCVVESPSDVLAIESTGGFKGKYFVLMGRLSPIDGISPDDLGIKDLLRHIKGSKIEDFGNSAICGNVFIESWTEVIRRPGKIAFHKFGPISMDGCKFHNCLYIQNISELDPT